MEASPRLNVDGAAGPIQKRPANVPRRRWRRRKGSGSGQPPEGFDITETEFKECAGCSAKPGSPTLCESCLHNRKIIERLNNLINNPQIDHFLNSVNLETAHQIERWGVAHDRQKQPADWFWLIGYLAGKCLQAHLSGDLDKAKHHTISTAAALYQWHQHITGGVGSGMSDVEGIVTQAFGKGPRE